MTPLVRLKSGPALRAAMDEAGISQRAMARLVGLSPQRFSQLIREAAPNVNVHAATAIEDTLECPRGTHFEPHPELTRAYPSHSPQE